MRGGQGLFVLGRGCAVANGHYRRKIVFMLGKDFVRLSEHIRALVALCRAVLLRVHLLSFFVLGDVAQRVYKRGKGA